MAIGNLIIFNMLGVVGVAGIIGRGIQIPAVAIYSSIVDTANLVPMPQLLTNY